MNKNKVYRRDRQCRRTLFDVLIFVVGTQAILLVESTERVYQMRTQVRIDVLRGKLGRARSINTPVRVVTHHFLLIGRISFFYVICKKMFFC